MTFEIKITPEYNGVKPKNYLKKNIDLPFFKIQNYIKDKRITLNGKKIKEDSVLKTGDIIKIWKDEIKLREVKKYQKESKNLDIPIIFENSDFLVLNKLSEVVVQGAQDNEKSLSLHLAYLKNKNKGNSDFEYFHVHRLDKDTSGVLVCAKNKISIRDFNALFRTRNVKKKYVCLCVGTPLKKEGKIDIFMRRNEEGARQKMSICNLKDDGARQSISLYKVIEEFIHQGELFSFIEVEIKTGITHQIRVHMKSLGCPILADKMYGNSVVNQKYEKQLNRQFLHAKQIEFEYKNQKYNFEAPLTQDLVEFLNYLKS